METVKRSGSMLTPEEKDELRRGFRLSQVVWATLIASLGLYIAIAHFLGEDIRQGMHLGEQLKMFETILVIASVVTFISIKYLKSRILMAGVKGNPGLVDAIRTSVSGQGGWAAQNLPCKRALQLYTTSMVVALALAESIGIYGLVMFMMGSDILTLYAFMAFSAASMYIYRPQYEEVERLAIVMKQSQASL